MIVEGDYLIGLVRLSSVKVIVVMLREVYLVLESIRGDNGGS